MRIFCIVIWLLLISPVMGLELISIDKSIDSVGITVSTNTPLIADKDSFKVEKTLYKGDIDVRLYEKYTYFENVVKDSYECNCEKILIEDNVTLKKKSVTNCETCYTYDTVEKTGIRPATGLNGGVKTYYEVARPKQIVSVEGGWGYSVWTDVYLFGEEIKGATWWNETWNFRRKITIANTDEDFDMFEYEMSVNLSSLNESIKTYCNDIVFAHDNGTLISHYIDYCNMTERDTAVFWLLLPLENGTNTVYMYYNSSANTTSSLTDVFGNQIRALVTLNYDGDDEVTGASGVITNAYTVADSKGGRGAYYFDGDGDSIAYSTYFVNNDYANWSFYVIHKAAGVSATYPTTYIGNLYSQYASGAAGRMALHLVNSTVYNNKYVYDTGGGTGAWRTSTTYDEHRYWGQVYFDIWQGAGVVRYPTKRVEFFINDSYEGYGTEQADIGDINSKLGAGYADYNGTIDEFRAYNRTLNASDIDRFFAYPYPTYILGIEEYNIPFIANPNKRLILFPVREIVQPS